MAYRSLLPVLVLKWNLIKLKDVPLKHITTTGKAV
jgi:hypothetical protein